MPWVPLKTSGIDYDENLPAGASWSGNNIVCNDVVVSTGTWFNFNAIAPPIRISVASHAMASPGAGLDYYRLGFVAREDTIEVSQFNEASPYPASTWGAGDISAFTPDEFELGNTLAETFSLEGAGGQPTEPFDMEFLIEVFVESAGACFWGDVENATQYCTP